MTRTPLNQGKTTDRTAWRRSTRSSGNGSSNCVEARAAGEAFELRDSKLGEESPIFPISVTEFESLLTGIKSGKIA